MRMTEANKPPGPRKSGLIDTNANMDKPKPKEDPKANPKKLLDDFYSKHCRSLPLQSFQILQQCYHPTFSQQIKANNDGGASASATEYVLVLEQQFRPQYPHTKKSTFGPQATDMTTIELNEMQNYAIQETIAEDFEEEQKGSMMSSQQARPRQPDRISCSYRELARNARQQLGITVQQSQQKAPATNADDSFSSDGEGSSTSALNRSATNKAGLRRGVTGKGAGAAGKQQSQILQIGKSKILQQTELEKIARRNNEDDETEKLCSYKLTLWKVDSREPAVILAEQKIEVTREVYILRNKMVFSQDGKFIMLVFVDSMRKLWRSITLDAFGLNHILELDINYSDQGINAQDVKHDPMIVKLKDEYALQLGKGMGIDETQMRRTLELNSKLGHYVISLIDQEKLYIFSNRDKCMKIDKKLVSADGEILKLKYLGIAIDDSEEKMVFLAKALKNEDDKKPRMIYYLTEIKKTLQKIISNGNPRFEKDDILYTAQINTSELPADFRVRQVSYHKDYGLFMKLTLKQEHTSRSSHLLYLPRTSLFTGKDTNQAKFKLADLQLMQNGGFTKDLCFVSQFETQYYVFLAKDLIKSEGTDIFTHKNTYQVKERFTVQNSNLLDFRSNLSQGYSTLLNVSQEVLERPYITFYLKSTYQEEGGLLQLIDKYEMINVNPYTILLEDRSMLNFYSYIEQDKHYRFKINDQFLSFVDIAKGSVQLEKEKYYRHQTCMYLTLNEKNQLKANFILMPSYSDTQQENFIYKYNQLPYSVDWTKYKGIQIQKATFVQFASTKNDSIIYLVIQLQGYGVVTVNLISSKIKAFETNSTVPILLQHPDPTSDAYMKEMKSEGAALRGLSFYVHALENGGQQCIHQLDLSPLEPPRMMNIMDYNGARILKLQQTNSTSIVLFDANLQVKKYKMQQKTQKMKLTDECRIIDEARKLLKSGQTGGTPVSIEVAEHAVYINSQFFQILKKTAQKDNVTEFEQSREKRVERHLNPSTLCLGPFLSSDKQNLVYIYRSNKSFGSGINKVDQKESGNEKQALLYRLLQALLKIREQSLMKPDEPHYSMVQVPLLSQTSNNLLHIDDYQSDQVEMTTFTAQDDILIKAKENILIFDKHGNQLKVKIDEAILTQHYLDLYELKQVQIVTRLDPNQMLFNTYDMVGTAPKGGVSNIPETFSALLFEKPFSLDAIVFSVKKNKPSEDDYGYRISIMIPNQKLINKALTDKKEDFIIKMRETRLEEDGVIYQLIVSKLLVGEDKWQEDLFFTKDGEKLKPLGKEMEKIYREKSKMRVLRRVEDDTRHSSVMEESKRSALNELLLKPAQNGEAQFMSDIGFKVLPMSADGMVQFIIFKKDLDIYYKNLLDKDPRAELIKLNKLDLDKGQITQILSTYQPHVVQFLYTQANPLQNFVFTWDLLKNMEVQMHTFTVSEFMPLVHITRGVAGRENYYIPHFEETLYDLRFQFPLNFFRGDEAHRGMEKLVYKEKDFKRNFDKYSDFVAKSILSKQDEIKVGSFNSAILGVSQARLCTLQFPHSFVALQYAQYVIDLYRELESKSETDKQKVRPILKYLRISFQHENNIYHLFALNESFLKQMAKEIRYYYIDLDDRDYLPYIYYVLLPNNTNTQLGRRPFSIALKQYSPKCLEQMFELLMIDTKQDYMRYIERYLSKLVEMNSQVFYRFLDVSCQRFQFRMQGSLKRESVYLQKPTQYINQTLFQKNFKTEVKANTKSLKRIIFWCCKKKYAAVQQTDDDSDDETEVDMFEQNLKNSAKPRKKTKKVGRTIKNIFGVKEDDEEDLDQYQLDDAYLDNDDALSDEYDERHQGKNFLTGEAAEKQASINFYTYEFESIIKGRKSESLIKYLSQQPLNSPLFESTTMQAFMDSQWQQFKWRYFMIVFLYLLSFLIMFPYFELFVHAMKDNDKPLSFIMKKHYVFFFMFLPVQFAVSVFLTYFEGRKAWISRDWFQAPIVFYNAWQIILPMIDMYEYVSTDHEDGFELIMRSLQYGLNANFILLGMIVLLYKIKYLNVASFYITRFYLIIKDTASLVFIIFIVEMTFAYAYKIIYSIQADHEKQGIGIIFKAFEFFNEDTYSSLWALWKTQASNDQAQQTQFVIMFVLLVLLTLVCISTNLLLFYFLIAAIIESFNKVSQNLKNQKYLARAKILFENTLLFRRDEVFADTRYVIKAQAERIDVNGGRRDWDGLATAISGSVKTTVEQEGNKNETNFKFLKNKIVKLAASQEVLQQQFDLQQADISSKMKAILRSLNDLAGASAGASGGGASKAPSSSATQAKKKDGKKTMADL